MCNALRMTDRLLGSTEACELLGISRSTLTQWLEKEWIKPVEQLSGGAYIFTESEVLRARATRAAEPEPVT